MRLDPQIVRQQIEQLKLLYPELVEDDEAWGLTLESETGLTELLTMAEKDRQQAAAFAGGIASHIAELEARQKRFERKEQAMRALLFKFLKAAETRKVELPIATISVRPGGVKLVINDEGSIPVELFRVKREPDRAAIKEYLAQYPDAARNWAALVQGDDTLAIRTK